MRLNVKHALGAVAAGAIVLSTVALQPAEARRGHGFHRGPGPVIVGALAGLAFVGAASEYGYPYYGYSGGYPYGAGYPYWNGYRYVYGPVYGGPVYGPPGGWR
jgi:hypothetical protein